jgi:hypothetical protein
MDRVMLREDPYRMFHGSRTPPGLYARKKWLQEEGTDRWRGDFNATVSALYQGQSSDGLWDGSAVETIQRLFGLHLTVRAPDARIHAALDRLLAMAAAPDRKKSDERIEADRLAGLPFAPGPRQPLVLAATLFLVTIFGRGTDPTVLGLYRGITSDDGEIAGDWTDPDLLNNRLRALAVHPRYNNHETARVAVERLAQKQTSRGDCGDAFPFFQTLNALAHLSIPSAEAQCRKAFGLLARIQQADGTWGRAEPVWCTFLSIHALRNQGTI